MLFRYFKMAWWNVKEWLYSKDPKWDPDKVICTIDDEEVEMAECNGVDSRLEEQGYKYDSGNEWYQREWTTNEGRESILEVYQQLENGEWNKLMIGYGDRVFYEEKVEKP